MPRRPRLDPRCGTAATGLALAILIAVLPPAVAAQERGPAFGQVVDIAGQPVQRGHVVCVGSEPWPAAADTEPAISDRVEAQTDARGRFVAKLLPGREYSAWAVDEVAADGTFRVSQMAHGLRIGGAAELKLGAPRRRQRAVLQGIDAWQDLGPLRIGRVVIGRHVLAIGTDADGFLPPMPEVHRFVVFDRDGVPLWDGPHSPGEIHERHVFVPAPRRAEVLVKDAQGKPIAGAEIWLEFDVPDRSSRSPSEGWHEPLRPRWFRRLGLTNAEGHASAVLPAWTGDLHWHLQARAAGHCRESFGLGESRMSYGSEPTQPLPVTLPEPMRFEVTLRPETAAVVVPKGVRDLDLLASVNWANNDNVPAQARVRTGPDGSVLLPFRRRPLSSEWFARTVDETGVATFGFVRPGAEAIQIDLQGHLVRVEVRDAQGGPALGARLLLFPNGRVAGLEVSLPLDRSGKVEVRLAAGAWMLWACDGVNSAVRMLPGLAGAEDVRLDLQPIPTAVLRFVDAAGKARAGAELWGGVSLDYGRNPNAETIALGYKGMALWPPSGRMRLDDEGCLRFPLLAPALTAHLSFTEAAGVPAVEVPLEPGEREVVCEGRK